MLAVLNVVTLCLVGLLYFQQGDREDQTSSVRAPARSAGADTAALEARLALVEEQLLQLPIAARGGPVVGTTPAAPPGIDTVAGFAHGSAEGDPPTGPVVKTAPP